MQEKRLTISIETSGRSGSAAVDDGSGFRAEREFSGGMMHSRELFPLLGELLGSAGRSVSDVEQLAVSAGPGSFTGLRIGVTAAKMLSLACGSRVISVSSLDVCSENFCDFVRDEGEEVSFGVVILDAKRGVFFTAFYEIESGGAKRVSDYMVCGAGEIMAKIEDIGGVCWVCGEGLRYYKDKFSGEKVRFLPERYWGARAVNCLKLGLEAAARGEFVDAAELKPIYLRRADAVKKKGL